MDRDDAEDQRPGLPVSTDEINAVIEVLERVARPSPIQVCNTQMTRQQIIEVLDDYITEAKQRGGVAGLRDPPAIGP